MANGNTSQEERLERLRKALKGTYDRIDSYDETNIVKGTGITSSLDLRPEEAYSKCFKLDLYDKGQKFKQGYVRDDDSIYDEPVPEKQDNTETVSEKYDKKRDLFKNEENVISGLNTISKMPLDKLYPDIFQKEPRILENDAAFKQKLKLAPNLYGIISEEERIIMEKLNKNFFKQDFINLDKRLYPLYEKCKLDGFENEVVNTINFIENSRKDYKLNGLYHIARGQYLFNKNSDLFDAKPRRKGEEVERTKTYLEDMLLAFHEEEGLSKEDLHKYLRSKKGISINDVARKMHEIKQKHLEKYRCIIHGDLTADHLNSEGTFIDFDEFRQDLPQDDIVRFLNNEFSLSLNDKRNDFDEKKIPYYIGHYFVDKKRFEGKIKWNDKYKYGDNLESSIAIISDYGMNEEFGDFLTAYYCERLEEDIHIFSINKRVSDERLKLFAEDHPTLKTKNDFQQFRINDIDTVLSILLRDGREKILKDPKGEKDTTIFFEDMRKMFEKSGVLKGDNRFGDLEFNF
jgi:hypothetical protein